MGCFTGGAQAKGDPSGGSGGSVVGSLMKKWMGTCFMATAQGFGWTLGAVLSL